MKKPKRGKNKKLLKEFIKFCKKHPGQRFWQALRNWSGADEILYKKYRRKGVFPGNDSGPTVGNDSHIVVTNNSHIDRYLEFTIEDTFYWEFKKPKK